MRALLRIAPAAVALAALALAAAACGGASGSSDSSEVASLDSASTQAAANTSDGSASDPEDFQDALLEYAQCMRDNGIDMPDPDFSGGGGGGGFQIGGDSGIDPNDPDFQAAQEACQDILGDARPQISEEDQQAFQDAFLEYAQCMRDNGIDMPDPDFSGDGGGFGIIGGNGNIDPEDPDFQAADEECRPILENAGLGQGPPGAGEANEGESS